MSFVHALADLLVASGVGALYVNSGTCIQVNFRRDPISGATADTVVTLYAAPGGQSAPFDAWEIQAVQAIVDARDPNDASTRAQSVYDTLHETAAATITGTTVSGSFEVLWMRAVSPPQAVPVGPLLEGDRHQFSVNFSAFIRKAQ